MHKKQYVEQDISGQQFVACSFLESFLIADKKKKYKKTIDNLEKYDIL